MPRSSTDGLGRAPSEGELYIAHFLGSDGAAKLIGAASASPTAKRRRMFPAGGAANRPIFFDRSGRGPQRRSTSIAKLTGRYDGARAPVRRRIDRAVARHPCRQTTPSALAPVAPRYRRRTPGLRQRAHALPPRRSRRHGRRLSSRCSATIRGRAVTRTRCARCGRSRRQPRDRGRPPPGQSVHRSRCSPRPGTPARSEPALRR